MAAIYFGQFALIALLLCTWAYANSECFGLGAGARVLIALSLTPFALASAQLLLAALIPGQPRILFVLIPGAVAAVGIWWLRGALCSAMRLLRRGLSACVRDPIGISTLFVSLAIVGAVLARIVAASDGTPIGHDALIYFSEARAFAEDLSLTSVPGFGSPLGHVVKTHPHHFLFQSYIAQALLAAPGAIGHPDDATARFAVQLLLLFAMAGAVGLAMSVGPAWSAPAAGALLFLMDGLDYIPRLYSRDAFRVLPFVALAALLLTSISRKGSLPWSRLVLIGVLVAANIGAHTVNIIFLALTWLALLLLVPLRALTLRNFLAISLASAPFAGLAGLTYVWNWWALGHPLGHGLHYYFYRGTPLWDAFTQLEHWIRPISLPAALQAYAKQYGAWFSAAAAAAAVFSVAAGYRSRIGQRGAALGVAYLVLYFVPLVVSIGELSLRGAMVSNLRYGIPVLALAPAVMSHAMGEAGHLLGRWRGANSKLMRPMAVLVFAALGLLAVHRVDAWYLYNNKQTTEYLNKQELFVARLAEQLPEGALWATDRYTVAYFSRRPPLFIYTDEGQPFLKATTENAVWSLIKSLNIRMVALHDPDPNWWPRTALYRALSSSKAVKRIDSESWKVFMIEDSYAGPDRVPQR